jgi:hypothetical protein
MINTVKILLLVLLLQGCALAVRVGPLEFGVHVKPAAVDPDWRNYRSTAECMALEPEVYHPACEWIDRWGMKP